MHREGRRADNGFTVIEIVVALAIIAILSVTLVVGLTPRISASQSGILLQELRMTSNGIQAFRDNVGRYPSTLSYLVTLPSNATDICGASIPAVNRSEWRGPYISMTPTAAGIDAGDATILLTLVRTPTTPTIPTSMRGTLRIRVSQVDSTAYEPIEIAIDGYSTLASRQATGSVQWGQSLAGITGTGFSETADLDFYIPIYGC